MFTVSVHSEWHGQRPDQPPSLPGTQHACHCAHAPGRHSPGPLSRGLQARSHTHWQQSLHDPVEGSTSRQCFCCIGGVCLPASSGKAAH